MKKKFLIIQTAFIGDVILATPLIEKLHETYPDASIDFLLRKGNEGLLEGHPYLHHLYIWDKKQGKYSQLLALLKIIRPLHYDYVINLQRFLSTGLFTALSGATVSIGFQKNPMSWLFTYRYPHVIDALTGAKHEVDRNISLLDRIATIQKRVLPRLYPSVSDFVKMEINESYITISPTSVWFTKQYPLTKWVEVIELCDTGIKIFLLGGKSDLESCEWIKNKAAHPNIEIMAGKLSFLESAALMKNAVMNYVNDSAPLHLASSMNAPVTAVFCSTLPAFGFGPLSENSRVMETSENLSCRPCGLHGYKSCPKGHFKCADIPARKIFGTNLQSFLK